MVDKAVTSRIMSKIKSKDTVPERILGRAMFQLGLRYRKHYNITGKPDFVFVQKKIAVFVDGDFWHGNNWKIRGLGSLEAELAGYSDFWREKILRNVERDIKVTNELKKNGWVVLRYYESDIKENHAQIAKKILKIYKKT